MLVPKSITCLQNYSKEQFFKDFIAGIIVAIIALPLSIALAIASGVSPEQGLYTAIIGGFIVSLLGGSRVQIGGPTGAFVVIVYGIIQKYGISGLTIATIMAGILLILMGLFKLGGLLKYIPYSITAGFTSGIAVVIFSTQIKDLLGLSMNNVPSQFLEKWISYFKNIGTANISAIIIATLTLAIIILWPKVNKKIPGTFIAIIIVTIITSVFNLQVETIQSKFGELSSSLPTLSIPRVNLNVISDLVMPAVTIAILGGVESLLSAVVADGMIGGKHRSNMELIAQGVANIFSGAFGGIPVTGAIARTAANVRNGGRTPIAGMVHSIAVLFIMLIFMPYVKLIPMSALAAILVVVSYNMGEWEAFEKIFKAPKSDALVLLVTFFLTVFLNLVVAIGVGVVLSSFLFMKKMAEIADVKCVLDDINDNEDSDKINNINLPDGVVVYEISGPFFFGAANKFVSAIREMGATPKLLIIKMSKVPFMDATAYHSFEMLYDICEKQGTRLIISNVQSQPMKMLKKYGYINKVGEENFSTESHKALINFNEDIAS
ncbi:SulP family inorganic anion transporter [Clostridium tarantellae]|uniref:Sulfate permease n=1 Tax=Clostridium tarantellae TaxID=39493 RepID=A0A6I1MR62_9CLOT|nr:sulfate permease [Clostridium tarantellae]MPQ44958.1 sulfate permease [Clostridium tarantellae]